MADVRHPSEKDLRRNWPSEDEFELLRLIAAEDDAEVHHRWQERRLRIVLDHASPGTIRLIPALYERLAAAGVEDPLTNRLKGVARHSWVSSVVKQRLLAEIARLFAHRGIELMAVKGMAVALLDADRPAKPMADVDGLVRHERAREAIEILTAAGWRPERGIRADILAEGTNNCHGWGFSRGDSHFDLHWNAVHQDPSPSFDGLFWSAPQARMVHGATLLLPPPTALLLQVSLHGVRWNNAHIWTWPVDAIAVIQAPKVGVDWDLLTRTCRERRLVLQGRSALMALSKIMTRPDLDAALQRLASEPVTMLEIMEHRGLAIEAKLVLRGEAVSCDRLAQRRRFQAGVLPPLHDWSPQGVAHDV